MDLILILILMSCVAALLAVFSALTLWALLDVLARLGRPRVLSPYLRGLATVSALSSVALVVMIAVHLSWLR